MLNSSYAAIQQFQSQISSVQNFRELNKLAKALKISVSVQISSATVWIAILGLTQRNLGGTIEIGIQPKLSIKSDVFEARGPKTFRLEIPNQKSLRFFESKILDFMKQSILSISKNSYSESL
jgi:hypothetical protein